MRATWFGGSATHVWDATAKVTPKGPLTEPHASRGERAQVLPGGEGEDPSGVGVGWLEDAPILPSSCLAVIAIQLQVLHGLQYILIGGLHFVMGLKLA